MKTVNLMPVSGGKFPDIPNMKFFQGADDLFYFNATTLLISAPEANLTLQGFFKSCSGIIGLLTEHNNLQMDDVAVRDELGNEYLEESMAVPFMYYLEKWFGPYMVERIEELIRFGFTINDNMLKYFHTNRFEQPTQE